MNWYSIFWLWWNHIAFIPLLFTSIFRFFYPSKPFTSTSIDLIVKACLSPSLIYYVFDSLYIIIQVHRFGWCNFAYLLHHLISLLGIKDIILLEHYPWFLISPFSVHCLLLMFPHTPLFNYIYFFLMIYCLFRLYQQPWRNIRPYFWLFKVMTAVILGPIILLWVNGCKNNMNNVD